MLIINQTRGTRLAEHATLARSMFARGVGLIGKRTFPAGHALVIRPCTGIHTFFMAFPLDVLYLAGDGTVLTILHQIKPWRIGPLVWKSTAVIELAAGTARATQTQEGDSLTFDSEENG